MGAKTYRSVRSFPADFELHCSECNELWPIGEFSRSGVRCVARTGELEEWQICNDCFLVAYGERVDCMFDDCTHYKFIRKDYRNYKRMPWACDLCKRDRLECKRCGTRNARTNPVRLSTGICVNCRRSMARDRKRKAARES